MSEKIKKAAQLLFFKRGKMPGAKEWELKIKLGKNYEEILKQLNEIINELGLEVKKVEENRLKDSIINNKNLSDQKIETRYLITLKETLSSTEAKTCGWRIDNLAGLAMIISYVISKQGKSSRSDVEKLLSQKLGKWRSMNMIDAFVRSGYLYQDDKEMISLGWRTLAEVDMKTLMRLLIES
jgi:intein/homing endonuclease